MKVVAFCKDNSGWEDQLTKGKTYSILSLSPTGSSVKIVNDKGEEKHYGLVALNLKEWELY